jgi:predicted  nucleic acid-binding Zn-ribbon protein
MDFDETALLRKIHDIEQLAAQHGTALLQLSDETAKIRDGLEACSQDVGQLERRVRAETETLDAHEKRIAALEKVTCGND